MKTVTMFRVKNSEKNKLWYKSLVGKLLNEAQLNEVLFNSWIDIERIDYRVREINPD